jgi:hypothetical protein
MAHRRVRPHCRQHAFPKDKKRASCSGHLDISKLRAGTFVPTETARRDAHKNLPPGCRRAVRRLPRRATGLRVRAVWPRVRVRGVRAARRREVSCVPRARPVRAAVERRPASERAASSRALSRHEAPDRHFCGGAASRKSHPQICSNFNDKIVYIPATPPLLSLSRQDAKLNIPIGSTDVCPFARAVDSCETFDTHKPSCGAHHLPNLRRPKLSPDNVVVRDRVQTCVSQGEPRRRPASVGGVPPSSGRQPHRAGRGTVDGVPCRLFTPREMARRRVRPHPRRVGLTPRQHAFPREEKRASSSWHLDISE